MHEYEMEDFQAPNPEQSPRHRRSLGEVIAQSAYTWSREGVLSGGAVSLTEARNRVRSALLAAGDRAAVAGIIPGHLKALLQAGDSRCILSVTRPGCCDEQPAGEGTPTVWRLTVNLISAIQPEEDPAEAVEGLFQ